MHARSTLASLHVCLKHVCRDVLHDQFDGIVMRRTNTLQTVSADCLLYDELAVRPWLCALHLAENKNKKDDIVSRIRSPGHASIGQPGVFFWNSVLV